MLQHVLEVHDAEAQVARLVLRAEAEDALLRLVLGDELAHAEHGLNKAFRLHVHDGGHLGEVAGVDDRAQRRGGAGLEQATAVSQRPLAEDVQVARLVHDLGAEEELRLEVLVADPGHPLARRVTSDELHLR